MRRYYKQFFCTLVFIFLTLILSSVAFSQDNIADSIQRQFNRYQEKAFQQKIFIHTDKTFYTAGEIIWFKIYNVSAYLNKPLSLEKICYVEVISKEQKPILQAKVELKNGTGSGSFLLPFSVNSGTFILRGYTSWMKNSSADYYFEQPITIVNFQKKPKWQEWETANQYHINFYPEGGNLVNGLRSKVAFKVNDEYGKGINCTGVILSQDGDTITHFQSLRFGMGNFTFVPVKGNTYKAVVNLENNHTLTQSLPTAYNEGYVMEVKDADSGHISIEVNANNNSAGSALYLITQTQNVIKDAQVKQFNNGSVTFLIDKNKLGGGISQFTIFNQARQPVCERLYFKRPQSLSITTKTDKQEYATREKVTLEIGSQNELQPVEADMSLSVFLLDSLQEPNHIDILNYLWLTSDLKGEIESPDYYFKNSDAEATGAIDNLMLTQGWRRFKWEDLLEDKTPVFEFLPEYEGQILNGIVTNKNTGTPAQDIPVYLSISGNYFQFISTVSQQNGSVQFVLRNHYGPGEIILQTNRLADSTYRIDVSDPFSKNFSATSFPQFRLLPAWKDQLALHAINAQAQNIYTKDKSLLLHSDLYDTLPFYGKADKTYYLDNYTRFVTMEEVMREYVAEVRVRKKNEQFNYEVKNIPYNSFFTNNPLVLLDGLPVFDINQVISYDPLKVEKIDIMARKYYLNGTDYDGIVSYSTYKKDFNGFELDPNALVLEYEGLQLKREFYSPEYKTAQQRKSRLPDYRTLLHWSPEIKTDEHGKQSISFYTSDLPGKYAVVVEGITPDGLCGSSVLTFDVRK